MGRIKGGHLKAASKELLAKRNDKFTGEFEHNKAALKKMDVLSHNSIERNKLAGDITRHKRAQLKLIAQQEAEAA